VNSDSNQLNWILFFWIQSRNLVVAKLTHNTPQLRYFIQTTGWLLRDASILCTSGMPFSGSRLAIPPKTSVGNGGGDWLIPPGSESKAGRATFDHETGDDEK
jgi:hypothetical protein